MAAHDALRARVCERHVDARDLRRHNLVGGVGVLMRARARVCVYVRACVCTCVRACVRACVQRRGVHGMPMEVEQVWTELLEIIPTSGALKKTKAAL